MKLNPHMPAGEFDEVCEKYSAHDEQGRDIVFLVKHFADKHDNIRYNGSTFLRISFEIMLQDHQRQLTIPMTGMILYLLVTYWHLGAKLFDALGVLEKMLFLDTVQQISEKINQESAANGNAVITVPE